MPHDTSETLGKSHNPGPNRRSVLGMAIAGTSVAWPKAAEARDPPAVPPNAGSDAPMRHQRESSSVAEPWKLSGIALATAIRQRRITAEAATRSVLGRVAALNPRLNAIVDVMAEEAIRQAQAADRALQRGEVVGRLHGVPVTIKINTDVAGRATTHGVVALRDNVAKSDAPLVTTLRREGAIIVGRTNAPAFSVRWFSDNDLHGRTLNPFDPKVTPGGSSGGAAVAVATGMGPIAHGNDIGGSLRQPALACGVVGLRPTVGRVPSYSQSSPTRTITAQQMSVNGAITRNVADARLMLNILAQGSPYDPSWIPAQLDAPNGSRRARPRVALFKRHAAFSPDPSVANALDRAGGWLAAAGYEVEEIGPPDFEEAADLWRNLLFNDMRRGGIPAVEAMGDESVKASMRFFMAGTPDWSRDTYLEGLARRETLRRNWSLFLEKYPVLLMPTSWENALPIDDDTRSRDRMEQILAAMSPLTTVAGLGLPGLSMPVAMHNGLPTGVQIVTAAFREDLALDAGDAIEAASRFDALDHLPV